MFNDEPYTNAVLAQSERRREARQMFAGVATIRAAIFDTIDEGFKGEPWILDPDDESDMQSEHRHNFVNAVISAIEDLQTAPFNHVKLHLCALHALRRPMPTSDTCVQCDAERGKANAKTV